MDHMMPVSRGGEHSERNVVPACKTCNSKKWNKTPLEFIGGLQRLGDTT